MRLRPRTMFVPRHPLVDSFDCHATEIQMGMPISNTNSPTHTPGSAPPRRDAFVQLAQSLRSGDVDSAKQAYASLIRSAPEGATWDRDSAYAQLGRALHAGDAEGARQIFTDMLKSRWNRHDDGVTTPVVPPSPTVSSSGGSAGAVLNVTA